MRVLMVVPGAEIGGVQTHVDDLACGLRDRHGVEVRVAVGSDGPLCERLAKHGIAVSIVPMRRRTDRGACAALQRLVADDAPGLVHTHGALAGILGREAARASGVRHLHTMHGLGVLDELRAETRWWRRLKLRHYIAQEARLNHESAAVIAVARAVGETAIALRHVPAARLHVIPNGVVPAAAPARLDIAAARIVFIGRLHREKGVHLLPAAIAAVRAVIPHARLVLIGDGPERAALRRAFSTRGVGDAVDWRGELTDIAPVLAEASCLVAPSRAEGLPYVLLEAMARGIPCVASAVGGTPDLIVHGRDGVLVPPDDVDALSGALLAVFGFPDSAAALGHAAWERVRGAFTRDGMVDATWRVYEEVGAR